MVIVCYLPATAALTFNSNYPELTLPSMSYCDNDVATIKFCLQMTINDSAPMQTKRRPENINLHGELARSEKSDWWRDGNEPRNIKFQIHLDICEDKDRHNEIKLAR